MRVLLIGYGSIGKRHEEVLLQLHTITSVDIVTKQNLKNKKTFFSLDKVTDLNSYDYFIIASPTNKHYEQIKFLESKIVNKIIFCEKPLFETKKELTLVNNQLYVGYVLRFHPLLKKLKNKIKDQKIINAHVNCGQYLPTWRSQTDYKESYSSKKDQGGGVLLDLSHEIDYIHLLFGKMQSIKSYQLKISDLEIDSDDIMTLIGKTQQGVLINLSIDYISKITTRRILVHTLNNSYELDFIANTLIQKNKDGTQEIYVEESFERNFMFEQMHQAVLLNKESVCTFEEAYDVMNTIYEIQEQNK